MYRITIFITISIFLLKLQTPTAQVLRYNFEKVTEIGNTIDSTLYNLDTSYVDSIFDYDFFTKRVIRDNNILNKPKNFEIVSNGVKKYLSFGKIIKKELEKGSYYDFLRCYVDKNKKFHLIFRLYNENDGLNYHDYILNEVKGNYKLIDVFAFGSGEYISDTFRTIYLQSFESENSFFSRYDSSLSKLTKIRKLVQEEKHQEAYDLYSTIPLKYANTKPFMLVYISITSGLDDEFYIKAIEEYERLYPNDPTLSLFLIDKNFIKEEYKKALKNIDDLDKLLVGDSFLDLYRGNIYNQMEDYETAKECYVRMVENYPFFYEGYDNLFSLYVQLGDKKNALKSLESIMTSFEYTKEDLGNWIKEYYPDFYKEESFKDWLK